MHVSFFLLDCDVNMNGMVLVSRLLLVSLVLTGIGGVQAFEISDLQIQINSDGSASVQVMYGMTDFEKGQYFLITRFLNPVSFGEDQINKILRRPVTIHSVSTDSANLSVSDIAIIHEDQIITPAFNFTSGVKGGDNYLLQLIERYELSFIPTATSITFPDGHRETFSHATNIPSITHHLAPGTKIDR